MGGGDVAARVLFLAGAGAMTQQELADEVGCTRQAIAMLEAGRYVPSLGLAMLVAEPFGRAVDEIFERV